MANSHGKFSWQTATTNFSGKFSQDIATANSQIFNAEDSVQYPPCRRASRVKIERKQATSYKTIASEMVKLED